MADPRIHCRHCNIMVISRLADEFSHYCDISHPQFFLCLRHIADSRYLWEHFKSGFRYDDYHTALHVSYLRAFGMDAARLSHCSTHDERGCQCSDLSGLHYLAGSKTGYLLGATPKKQQIGEIIGLILPALAIGVTLQLLDSVYTLGSSLMPAPQATMMALIAKGVLEGNIPTTLVVVGAVIGILIELLKLPILPFAIGLYLPLPLSTSVMIGGLVAAYVKKKNAKGALDNGVITASGLVAGDAATGVILAFLAALGWVSVSAAPLSSQWVSLGVYALLALFLAWFSLKPPFKIK